MFVLGNWGMISSALHQATGMCQRLLCPVYVSQKLLWSLLQEQLFFFFTLSIDCLHQGPDFPSAAVYLGLLFHMYLVSWIPAREVGHTSHKANHRINCKHLKIEGCERLQMYNRNQAEPLYKHIHTNVQKRLRSLNRPLTAHLRVVMGLCGEAA